MARKKEAQQDQTQTQAPQAQEAQQPQVSRNPYSAYKRMTQREKGAMAVGAAVGGAVAGLMAWLS